MRTEIHAHIIPENCRFNLWELQLNSHLTQGSFGKQFGLTENRVGIIPDDNILSDQWKAIEKGLDKKRHCGYLV